MARISGDEFVFLCEGPTSPADSDVLAERIRALFGASFATPDGALQLSASVGIAYCGPAQNLSYELVTDADTAMFQAKRGGGSGHHVLDLRAAHHARAANHLEEELRRALRGGGLSVHYQPIVELPHGVVCGVEALLRWSRPLAGPVPAKTVIELAERSALILEVGGWVLSSACRAQGDLLTSHPDHALTLAVNISGREVLSGGFVSSVAAALASTNLDPSALILEVTEGILIDAGDHALSVMADLKALDVRLALDDFGTGYSSMSYLRHFPVDIVKIDQRFVVDVDRDPTAAAIVSAITNLAHDLGMTVAEGVENLRQRDCVIALGCDFAQGFHYSKSLTLNEMSSPLSSAAGGSLTLP